MHFKSAKESIQESIPPNWNICVKHRNSHYLYNVEDLYKPSQPGSNQFEYCPCCDFICKGPRVRLCTSSEEISKYGFGLTLYFLFELFLARLLALLLIPCCLTIAAYTVSGLKFGNSIGNGFTIDTDKVGDMFSWWSISLCNKNAYGPIMMISCIIFCLIYYSGSRLVSRWTYRDGMQLNNNQLDPTDYSIMIKSLPKKFDKRVFISSFCRFMGLREEEDISRVVFTNDISKYADKMKKYMQLVKTRALIEKYRSCLIDKGIPPDQAKLRIPSSLKGCGTHYKNDRALNDDIRYMESKLNEMQKSPSLYLKEAPVVFITFSKTTTKNRILDKHKSRHYKKTKIPIIDAGIPSRSKYKVRIMNPEEPSKVIWENLHCTSQTLRSVFTWFITLLIIAASFVGNYYLKKNGEKYALKIAKSNNPNSTKVKIFTLFSSILIAIINMIVVFIIPILVKLEKRISLTDYHSSASFKLALAQFLNTALIPLIVNWKAGSYFVSNGLINQVALNWVFLIFVTPIVEIFDPLNILKKIRVCIARSKGDKSELMQSEANTLYLPPVQPMCLKYSNLLLIIYYSAFYLQLWPPGIVLLLVGILFNYLVDKLLTIYRYSRLEYPSESIAFFNANALVGGIIFIAAGNIIFIYRFESIKNTLIYGLIPIVLIVIFIICSECCCRGGKHGKANSCIACFCHRKNEEFKDLYEGIPYDIERFGDEDYMAFNPITRKQALIDRISSKITKCNNEEEKKNLTLAHNELFKSQASVMIHPQLLEQSPLDLFSPNIQSPNLYPQLPQFMNYYMPYEQPLNMYGNINYGQYQYYNGAQAPANYGSPVYYPPNQLIPYPALPDRASYFPPQNAIAPSNNTQEYIIYQ